MSPEVNYFHNDINAQVWTGKKAVFTNRNLSHAVSGIATARNLAFRRKLILSYVNQSVQTTLATTWKLNRTLWKRKKLNECCWHTDSSHKRSKVNSLDDREESAITKHADAQTHCTMQHWKTAPWIRREVFEIVNTWIGCSSGWMNDWQMQTQTVRQCRLCITMLLARVGVSLYATAVNELCLLKNVDPDSGETALL